MVLFLRSDEAGQKSKGTYKFEAVNSAFKLVHRELERTVSIFIKQDTYYCKIYTTHLGIPTLRISHNLFGNQNLDSDNDDFHTRDYKRKSKLGSS